MKERGGVVEAPSAIKADGGKYRQLPGNPVRSGLFKHKYDKLGITRT
jgi:hypothetical protein